MHVDPEHAIGASGYDLGRRQPRLPARFDQAAQRMEQEGPRAAGRIEHTLFQRSRDRRRDDPRRQPVGRVVFAEVVTLVGIDQALIETLEHVDLDVAQSEAQRLRGERAHQVETAFS